MARKSKNAAIEFASVVHAPVVRDWEVADTYAVGRRTLTTSSVIAVKGEKGATFRFLRHVRRPDGTEWIDCVGGVKHGINETRMLRSFRPERISRIVRA